MSKENHLFIGIDAGTSVTKSVLFDGAGNELSSAQSRSPLESEQPGYQEMDLKLVWAAAKESIKALVEKAAGFSGTIKAIGITGQGCGAWLIDKDGEPVRKAILWSDSRAADLVNEWDQEGVGEQVYKLTGNVVFSGGQGAILKWLSLHEPQVLDKAEYALYCKDWIKYKLTGVISTDPSEAVISYLDIEKETYSDEVIHLLGIEKYRRLLPDIHNSSEGVYELQQDVAMELGLEPGVRVVSTPFDISASAIGVGAIADGDACAVLGTASINEIVIDTPAIEPLNIGYTVPLGPDQRWVRMLNPNLGTPNFDWFLENFCHEDYIEAEKQGRDVFEYLQDKISGIPIGAQGILYNPFLASTGLRAPFLNEHAKAHFIGLAPHHTRYHLLRALFEGAALAMKHSYANLPRQINELNFAGGGSRSPLWCQIVSDCLNVRVRVPSGSEFGAQGAAITAAVSTGYFENYETAVKAFVRYEREYDPIAENNQKYEKLFEIYTKLYPKLTETWQELALLEKGL